MSEPFMPSVPIVMPSEILMVLNSSGVQPDFLMPSRTLAARRRRWKLHGPISVQVLAMPIIGLFKSSSVRPMAFNIERAPARSGPSSSVRLVRLSRSFTVVPLVITYSFFDQYGRELAHFLFSLPHSAMVRARLSLIHSY